MTLGPVPDPNEAKPGDGWTIIGPTDRAMDVHLQLLVDEATDALNRVQDIEKIKGVMGKAVDRRRLTPRF